jgi:hypothetical protein
MEIAMSIHVDRNFFHHAELTGLASAIGNLGGQWPVFRRRRY